MTEVEVRTEATHFTSETITMKFMLYLGFTVYGLEIS